jgi:hypothetical protein
MEVEFQVVKGAIAARKKPRKLAFAKWKGRFAKDLRRLGFQSGDEFVEAIRGR